MITYDFTPFAQQLLQLQSICTIIVPIYYFTIKLVYSNINTVQMFPIVQDISFVFSTSLLIIIHHSSITANPLSVDYYCMITVNC